MCNRAAERRGIVSTEQRCSRVRRPRNKQLELALIVVLASSVGLSLVNSEYVLIFRTCCFLVRVSFSYVLFSRTYCALIRVVVSYVSCSSRAVLPNIYSVQLYIADGHLLRSASRFRSPIAVGLSVGISPGFSCCKRRFNTITRCGVDL